MPTEKEIDAIKARLKRAAEIEDQSATAAFKLAEYAKRTEAKQRKVKARDQAASRAAQKKREAAKKVKKTAQSKTHYIPEPESAASED